MKVFFGALLMALTVLIGAFLLFAATIGSAYADEVPNIQCDNGDAIADSQCMREHWRPKKQVSYDTAKPYCTRNGGKLQGQGEIVLYVDDTPFTFNIDCK